MTHHLPPAAHPAWCSPNRCEAQYDRFHSSEVLVVSSDLHSSARVQLRLWRPTEDLVTNAPTYIEVIVGDHDQAQRLRTDLSLPQADLLRLFLGDLLRMTGGKR